MLLLAVTKACDHWICLSADPVTRLVWLSLGRPWPQSFRKGPMQSSPIQPTVYQGDVLSIDRTAVGCRFPPSASSLPAPAVAIYVIAMPLKASYNRGCSLGRVLGQMQPRSYGPFVSFPVGLGYPPLPWLYPSGIFIDDEEWCNRD